MIQDTDLIKIGKISKTRGIKGEVDIHSIPTADEWDYEDAPCFFMMMNGLWVPMFWNEYMFKGENTLCVKFEGYETDEQARALVRKEVYIEKKYLSESVLLQGFSSQFLIGCTLYNRKTKVGQITNFFDDTANELLEIDNDLLVPFHENLVVDFDDKARVLTLDLPEGLL